MATALTKEGNSLTTIQQTMVVCQSDNHDRADDDLTVYDDSSILDGMHTKYGGLRKIDYGRAVERAKYASI